MIEGDELIPIGNACVTALQTLWRDRLEKKARRSGETSPSEFGVRELDNKTTLIYTISAHFPTHYWIEGTQDGRFTAKVCGRISFDGPGLIPAAVINRRDTTGAYPVDRPKVTAGCDASQSLCGCTSIRTAVELLNDPQAVSIGAADTGGDSIGGVRTHDEGGVKFCGPLGVRE